MGASAVYAIFTIIGDVVDGIGYRKVPVSHVMSSGTFIEGLPVAVSFARTGDKGLDGLGAGDTISDVSSITSGRLVKYSDPSGKHITDAGASIGTSGHSVPVLDADNTWSGAQSFDGRSVHPQCIVCLHQDLRCLRDEPVPWAQEPGRWCARRTHGV